MADADLTVEASVTTTDAAGNAGTATRHRELHGRRHRAGAAITLDAITADDIINAAEAGGTVAITGTVGGDVQERRHRHPDGERHRPTPARSRRQHLLDQRRRRDLVADADFTIDASVSTTDAAGNVGTATATPRPTRWT